MHFWNDVYRWHTNPRWNGDPCRLEVFWYCQMCQTFFASFYIADQYLPPNLNTEKHNNTLSKQLLMLLKYPSKNISKIILTKTPSPFLLIPSVLFPVQTTEFMVVTSEGFVLGLLQIVLFPDLMPCRKNALENLLLYYHVDGSRKLLRNVGTYIPTHTTSYPRRLEALSNWSSIPKVRCFVWEASKNSDTFIIWRTLSIVWISVPHLSQDEHGSRKSCHYRSS